jgi:hypothetical protein
MVQSQYCWSRTTPTITVGSSSALPVLRWQAPCSLVLRKSFDSIQPFSKSRTFLRVGRHFASVSAVHGRGASIRLLISPEREWAPKHYLPFPFGSLQETSVIQIDSAMPGCENAAEFLLTLAIKHLLARNNMASIQMDEGIEHRQAWEHECAALGDIDAYLFAQHKDDFLFGGLLLRPTCHYLVIKSAMVFWDVCTRMATLYNAKTMKLRIAVTAKSEGPITDLDFEQRICEFCGPPGLFPVGADFTFNMHRDKVIFIDGNFNYMSQRKKGDSNH